MNRTNHFFLTFTNKILAGLLSLLGFSLAACDKIGADEYGCPYADYEIKGKVVDENGKAINGIQVIIPDPFGNEEYTHRDTLITNSAGELSPLLARISLSKSQQKISMAPITEEHLKKQSRK